MSLLILLLCVTAQCDLIPCSSFRYEASFLSLSVQFPLPVHPVVHMANTLLNCYVGMFYEANMNLLKILKNLICSQRMGWPFNITAQSTACSSLCGLYEPCEQSSCQKWHLGIWEYLPAMQLTTFKGYFEFYESIEEAKCSLKFGDYTVFYTCDYSCDTQCIQMYFNIPWC